MARGLGDTLPSIVLNRQPIVSKAVLRIVLPAFTVDGPRDAVGVAQSLGSHINDVCESMGAHIHDRLPDSVDVYVETVGHELRGGVARTLDIPFRLKLFGRKSNKINI